MALAISAVSGCSCYSSKVKGFLMKKKLFWCYYHFYKRYSATERKWKVYSTLEVVVYFLSKSLKLSLRSCESAEDILMSKYVLWSVLMGLVRVWIAVSDKLKGKGVVF